MVSRYFFFCALIKISVIEKLSTGGPVFQNFPSFQRKNEKGDNNKYAYDTYEYIIFFEVG